MVWPEDSKDVFWNKMVPRSIVSIPETSQPQGVHHAPFTTHVCASLCLDEINQHMIPNESGTS